MAKKLEPVSITYPGFKTSRGVVIPCKPVNRWLIDTFNSSKKEVFPPTYEITTAAGTVEVHYHDEKSVQTDEEKAALLAYEKEKNRIDVEHNRKFYELLVLEGTELALPEDGKWKKRLTRLGIQLPEDEDELYLFYIQNECFNVEEDATDLMSHIVMLSGTEKEVADQLKKSFRAAVQEARDRRNKIARERTLGK